MDCCKWSQSISLYSFYDLYVEVIKNGSSRTVLCINAFDDVRRLDPYLEQIDISRLFQSG